MHVEVKQLPSMRIVYLKHIGPYDQVGPLFKALSKWAGRNRLFGRNTRMLGMAYDDPEKTPAEQLRYEAAITVPDDYELPHGATAGGADQILQVRTIPSGRYACAMHIGPYDRLSETYQELSQWLAQSEHEPDDESPCLEYYLSNPLFTLPSRRKTEVCVRVKAAQ